MLPSATFPVTLRIIWYDPFSSGSFYFSSLAYIVTVVGPIRISQQWVWRVLFILFLTIFLFIVFLSVGFSIIAIIQQIRFSWWWMWQWWVWIRFRWYVPFYFFYLRFRWLCWWLTWTLTTIRYPNCLKLEPSTWDRNPTKILKYYFLLYSLRLPIFLLLQSSTYPYIRFLISTEPGCSWQPKMVLV